MLWHTANCISILLTFTNICQWWGTDFCYPSPENTDNHCSVAQESGFDWSELANGDNWSYEGFSFDGFAPKDGCRASGVSADSA